MKKILLSFTIIALSVGSLFAQEDDKKLSKIAFQMVDRKYEDVVKNAEKLSEDSEYRRNPTTYMYLAQGYFELARNLEYQEDYPSAIKESLKAAYKMVKYAEKEDNAKLLKINDDFLTKLKDSVIKIAEIYYDTDNPRKAAYYMSKIVKFDADDYSVWLMKGVYEIKSRNIGEGVKSIKLAMENIDANYVPDEVSAQTLVNGLEEWATLVKNGEYNKYFDAYKFEVNESQAPGILAMSKEKEKYLIGEKIDVASRKKESEVIYKSFKSDTEEEEDDDDE
tara:strand:- start:4522 stop:5358 length:837 start_codon:yes stop_codon:yes gene_type:complete